MKSLRGKAIRRAGTLLVVLVATLAGVAGCGSAPVDPAHVVIVVLENKDNTEILGSPDAPYLNELASSGAVFTNAHGVAHPSQPNYLALFSGSTQGVRTDDCPLTFDTPNLGRALLDSGRSFAGYSEDLPAPGFTGCAVADYGRWHNPWADFGNLPPQVNQPFTAFGPDFAALPTVSVVVPNHCDDMHNCPVATGDAWLRTHLDPYRQWALTHQSLLVVTWDESDTAPGNQIATMFVGPMVKPGHYAEYVDHYVVLRTIEDLYRLPHLGQTGSVQPVRDVWSTTWPAQ